MTDELSARYAELLDGTYDCVDRIVLTAYYSRGHSAGGFRVWWRSLMGGSEDELDNAHLMRLAGRFSRRVRGFAKAHQRGLRPRRGIHLSKHLVHNPGGEHNLSIRDRRRPALPDAGVKPAG